MSVDDLYNLFTTFWCTSDHWYPTERERIQHALLLLLIVYTTARPSALLATDPYEKLDNSLLYKDIRVFLVRDPQNPTKTLLLMLIKIRLNKGKRNVGTPYVLALSAQRRLMTNLNLDLSSPFTRRIISLRSVLSCMSSHSPLPIELSVLNASTTFPTSIA